MSVLTVNCTCTVVGLCLGLNCPPRNSFVPPQQPTSSLRFEKGQGDLGLVLGLGSALGVSSTQPKILSAPKNIHVYSIYRGLDLRFLPYMETLGRRGTDEMQDSCVTNTNSKPSCSLLIIVTETKTSLVTHCLSNQTARDQA